MKGVWVYIVDIVQAGGGGVWSREGLEGGSEEPKKKKGIVKRDRRPRKRNTSVGTLGIQLSQKIIDAMTSSEARVGISEKQSKKLLWR